MLEPILEGVKVRFEVVIILFPEQIQYIREHGKWPETFEFDEAARRGGKEGKDKTSYSDIYAGLDSEDSASGDDEINISDDPTDKCAS